MHLRCSDQCLARKKLLCMLAIEIILLPFFQQVSAPWLQPMARPLWNIFPFVWNPHQRSQLSWWSSYFCSGSDSICSDECAVIVPTTCADCWSQQTFLEQKTHKEGLGDGQQRSARLRKPEGLFGVRVMNQRFLASCRVDRRVFPMRVLLFKAPRIMEVITVLRREQPGGWCKVLHNYNSEALNLLFSHFDQPPTIGPLLLFLLPVFGSCLQHTFSTLQMHSVHLGMPKRSFL